MGSESIGSVVLLAFAIGNAYDAIRFGVFKNRRPSPRVHAATACVLGVLAAVLWGRW